MDDRQRERLHGLLTERSTGTLATIRAAGRPQLSVVSYTYDPSSGRIRVSTVEGRAKTVNAGRDPRVSLVATTPDQWSYAVAEGTASLSAVAASPDDAVVEELVDVYRAISGEHPDWGEYRAAMVDDRRMVLTITVDRVYGLVRG